MGTNSVWDGYVINVKEHFLNKALLQQQLDSSHLGLSLIKCSIKIIC